MHKKLSLLFLVIFATILTLGILSTCQSVPQNSTNLEIPLSHQDAPAQLIQHMGYTVSYNSATRIPNWVAYELTHTEVEGELDRNDHFYQDPLVVGVQATNQDYRRSGYDRGHLAPAADMKWDPVAMRECFYFSNICPQNHGLNAGLWLDFENRCRKWAAQYGKAWIVCGPLIEENKYGTIGENKIQVPDALFKAVLVPVGVSYEGIAWVCPNQAGRKKIITYICTIDSLEKRTGIDFFYNLPSSIQEKVESRVNMPVWGWKKAGVIQ